MDTTESDWIIVLTSRVTGYRARFNPAIPGPLAIHHHDRLIEFHPALAPPALALAVLVAIADVLLNWVVSPAHTYRRPTPAGHL